MVKKTIGGEDYDYTLCPRCGVWILTENFNGGDHEGCDLYLRNRGVRERAEARVI